MTFPLAGLLRVRGAQERAAAEQLSRATADRRNAEAARESAVSSLTDLESAIHDRSTLLALAAARAAGSHALSELQALAHLRRSEEAQAKAAHVDARREVKGLERLETTHLLESTRAELHAEQVALDEIAVARAARVKGSAA